jgi:hypothetical protein
MVIPGLARMRVQPIVLGLKALSFQLSALVVSGKLIADG